ncbi:MAG: ribbon-helix-helix domain-containing protein [Polaribacter sp.]|uniref:ribbon-helix-helix domain-containing protein n=1 Tax=Polaribacter sp. TaxID=1920175 RepID=UPI002F34FF3C
MNTTTINFRIDELSKDELQEIAEERGIKVSNLVREIITAFLENYNPHGQEDNEVHKIVLEIPHNYNQFQ